MLKIVPEHTHIPFLKFRNISIMVSLVLIAASIGLFIVKGLNLGIDFAGGVMIHIKSPTPVEVAELRDGLSGLGLGDVSVQEFGRPEEVLIRVEAQGSQEGDQDAIAAAQGVISGLMPEVSYERIEDVGGQVSTELVRDGILAVVFAVGAVLVYIWFRFEWHFGVGAVIALIHDVVLTIGFFALTGLEFNLSIIAAILTIVGYSLNDTVVVFDRIRENLRKFRKMKLEELLDMSINNTLSRTLMTSLTTLVALFALFTFGGEVIRGFTAAMIWGIFVGTYSSIFIAAPTLIYLKMKRTDVTAEEAGA